MAQSLYQLFTGQPDPGQQSSGPSYFNPSANWMPAQGMTNPRAAPVDNSMAGNFGAGAAQGIQPSKPGLLGAMGMNPSGAKTVFGSGGLASANKGGAV